MAGIANDVGESFYRQISINRKHVFINNICCLNGSLRIAIDYVYIIIRQRAPFLAR